MWHVHSEHDESWNSATSIFEVPNMGDHPESGNHRYTMIIVQMTMD